MDLVIDKPSQITPSSPKGVGCNAQAGNLHSESPRNRPGTPQRMIQNLITGRSISPFRSIASGGSGLLGRTGSLRSSSKECKRKSKLTQSNDIAQKEFAGKPAATYDQPATSEIARQPSRRVSSNELKSSSNTSSPLAKSTKPLSETDSERTLAVSSPGLSSPTGALSIDNIEDEDLASTRSVTPFEDLVNSQVSQSTEATQATIWEDLPENLRLMRVAQRNGIKVIDFAFEGPKREGVIEDWAWEGGAACKGFGIGIGGGAYGGPLKKYRPPPVERPPTPPEDDEMDIDRPTFSWGPHNLFSPSPVRPFAVSPRIFVSAPSSADMNTGTAGIKEPKQSPTFARFGPFESTETSLKRDRSAASAEPDKSECSPFKKRLIG
ncbi:hypothetical protein CPB86DRAFT_779636 [Serendipita vermifera]|nr:hypothetical protein CPB86DRAFT_779636 [Serendipita vermifera]